MDNQKCTSQVIDCPFSVLWFFMQFNTKSFLFLLFLFVSVNPLSRAEKNWHQAAGPNGNWQTEGQPPLLWSATRNENIRWRTPMPEAGMSNGFKMIVTSRVASYLALKAHYNFIC
jgi:hypothetical protein